MQILLLSLRCSLRSFIPVLFCTPCQCAVTTNDGPSTTANVGLAQGYPNYAEASKYRKMLIQKINALIW